MAIAPLEYHREDGSLLSAVHSDLLSFAREFGASNLTLNRQQVATMIVDVEKISKVVDHLQTLAARAAEDHELSTAGQPEPYRSTADYLRAKIGISRSEANRRLRLGGNVLAELPGPGAAVEAPMAALGDAMSSGAVSGRAATVICDAVQRVRSVATSGQLASMEDHLTRQAIESDEDILRALARRWESVLDQDGQEPTEKTLRARQGVFLRGRRHGLHFMEIGATDEQFEHLITVMNTAANPRAQRETGGGDERQGADGTGQHTNHAAGASGTGSAVSTNHAVSADRTASTDHAVSADRTASTVSTNHAVSTDDSLHADRPTRAQNLLDGLVSACRVALSGDDLPATGGHRPQVMVTINYRDLLSDMGHDGHSVFAQQMSARNIRKIACDADILPLVLGGKGQILDIGRAQRLFPPHMRRALVARDKGCAFPDCSIPATWCEAHHIVPWAAGGTTNVSDGVLLCARHHHLLHEGNWSVESVHGIPWFKPPKYVDPDRALRRNRFWQVEEAVHRELVSPQTHVTAEKAVR